MLSTSSGWWLSLPLLKMMEFVIWDNDINKKCLKPPTIHIWVSNSQSFRGDCSPAPWQISASAGGVVRSGVELSCCSSML